MKTISILAPMVFLTLATTLLAADPPSPEKSLGDMSIEELMNESVTSVSKREQRLSDVASAITVLTNEDLRRSGAVSIPEALRLVPGMDVGQVNASEWAVSARGFDGIFSNKLLVLVDGRAVYSSLFSGVYWNLQQVMLDDVDRIEVIRGPGATIWGANAINGVINVISSSARDTQGGLLYSGGGDQHELLGGVRYGGQISPTTYYRVFASYHTDRDFPLASGMPGLDGWQGRHGGFRVDSYPASDTHLTWQADATDVRFKDSASSAYNYNTLGRWTRQLSESSNVEVQAYYDRVFSDDVERAKTCSDTMDLAVQHTFGLGPNQNVIWGGGYRYIDSRLAQTTPFLQIRHDHLRQELFNAFLQDEFQFIPDKLIFTAGIKLEHNNDTEWEFQPSIRAVFKPTSTSAVWAAVSRAVRTPNATESEDAVGIMAGPPVTGPDGGIYLPTIVGNGQPAAETLQAYEAGYRSQATRHVSIEVALFYNTYRKLIGAGDITRFVPGVPFGIGEIPFTNELGGNTYGGETSLIVSPVDTWRLTVNYSRLEVHMQDAPNVSVAIKPNAPRHQVLLRSSYDFTPRVSLDVQLRHVSALPDVPAYTTADCRLAYRWSDELEFSLVGQNLFDRQHAEQAPQQTTVTTEVPRMFYGKVTWHF